MSGAAFGSPQEDAPAAEVAGIYDAGKDGFADNANSITDAMVRLARFAPAAGSAPSMDLLRVFLSKEHPVSEALARVDVFNDLDADGKDLYNQALKKGTVALLDIVESVVSDVVGESHKFKNLAQSKRKGGGVYPLAPEYHDKYRFTAYDALRKRLDYTGSRVPLPLVCETVIKLCFPAPQGGYTLFAQGTKRPRGEE